MYTFRLLRATFRSYTELLCITPVSVFLSIEDYQLPKTTVNKPSKLPCSKIINTNKCPNLFYFSQKKHV